jgi:hypothetical protein
MPPTEVSTSSIEVVFEGLMILTLDRKAGADPAAQCAVHLLDFAPGHILNVSILQSRGGDVWDELRSYDEDSLSRFFSLDVTDVSRPGFEFEANFFSKAVDLESSSFYDKRVNLKPIGISSTFLFNNGRFRVAAMSLDKLFISRGNGTPQPFRQVATRVAADITLERAESQAIFANGGDRFRFKQPGPPCRIVISQSPANRNDHSTRHAELYNNVVAFDEPEEDKIHYHPDPAFRHDLEHEHDTEHDRNHPEKAADGDARILPIPPHALCFPPFLGEGPR